MGTHPRRDHDLPRRRQGYTVELDRRVTSREQENDTYMNWTMIPRGCPGVTLTAERILWTVLCRCVLLLASLRRPSPADASGAKRTPGLKKCPTGLEPATSR